MWTKAVTDAKKQRYANEIQLNKVASQNVKETAADNDQLPNLLKDARNTASSRAIADVIQGLSDTPAPPEMPKSSTMQRAQKAFSKAGKASKTDKIERKDKK